MEIKRNFSDYLVEDHQIREYVKKKKLYVAGVSKILIERSSENKIRVIILTAKPGMVIGRSGDGVEALKGTGKKLTGKEVEISIEEVRRSELDAQLTAESVAQALEKACFLQKSHETGYRQDNESRRKGNQGSSIRQTRRSRDRSGAKKYSEGNVPLHTLRADIDYGFAEADTTYGKIGVKVWINHGEILDKGLQNPIREEKREKRERRPRKDGERRQRRDGDRQNTSGKTKPR